MGSTPTTPNPLVLTLAQRTANNNEWVKQQIGQAIYDLRCALVCVVTEFDAVRQVVTVEMSLTENLVDLQEVKPFAHIPLVDLPIVFPRAGGFSLTFPIAVGDECLVVFQDMARDSWWQSGGANNNQAFNRRHSISDGFAIFGPWSKPRSLSNYSIDSCQLRSDDGTVGMDLRTGQITIQAPEVIITSGSGTPFPVVMKAFFDWFVSTYMPSVVYVTSPPAVPSSGMVSTVLKVE